MLLIVQSLGKVQSPMDMARYVGHWPSSRPLPLEVYWSPSRLRRSSYIRVDLLVVRNPQAFPRHLASRLLAPEHALRKRTIRVFRMRLASCFHVAFLASLLASFSAAASEESKPAQGSNSTQGSNPGNSTGPANGTEPGPYDPISHVCHDNGFFLNTRRNHSVTNRARPGDWTTTCENEVLNLDCGRGNLLRIIDVEYGRFDTTTCHSYPMFFMRCEATEAYHKVHQRCDNKQRCTIASTADEFGDPCPGIIKYLRVKHKCEPVAADALKSKTICEHEKGSIECPEGKKVMIADAFYGRMDSTTCPHKDIKTTNCRSKHALDIIGARCDHKPNCTLSSDNSEFDDPCKGTYKYIQVDYQCVVDDLEMAVACQGGSMVLECKNMSIINVVRAEYGRAHPFICNPTNKRIESQGCSSPNELAIAFGRCQGRTTCTIPATSEVFGEPCNGKPKYLEMDFFCTDLMDESDSGGPPAIKSLGTDRVAFYSNKLNATSSPGYMAQMKGANEDQWFTVMDADDEKFDFSEPHTIGGLYPGEKYDARIIKKRGVVSSCIPFTRIRARNE